MRLEIKILDQRLHDWGLPRYQSAGAAAIDLFACVDGQVEIRPQAPAILIPSGIAMLFGDDRTAALILPRSGAGHRSGLVMGNSVGLIDPDYTGEVMISVWNRNPAGHDPIVIDPGDRIAQMVFVPVIRPDFSLVAEFSAGTERAGSGFGSTGS